MPGANHEVKILLVDDNDTVRRTLERVLLYRGYQVASVATRAAALELISTYIPHVLLCDVILPDGNGIEVAKEICRRLKCCRAILISGDPATAELVEQAARDGITFEVLAKPLHPEMLFAALERLV